MSIISKLQKVTSIPLRISINKLFEKLFTINNRYNKLIKLYNNNIYHSNINYFIPSFINLLAELSNNINSNTIDNILMHNFDLLGSSNIIISYNTDVTGFNGIKYKNNLPLFTTLSDACNFLLLNRNKQVANSLAKFISNDYKLIDWQLDFRSGYRWSEKIESKKIRIGEMKGADIKVPWELARFQHLPLLAIYYAKNPNLDDSKKHKLVNEFYNEILDFIAFNPLNYGIHWKVAMEASIRTSNLILAYQIFKSQNIQFKSDFESIFYNFLQNSLHFIIENIEWSSGLRGNHYFTNISALLYLATFLGLKQYQELYNFAVNEIINETLVQFNQDGGDFEGSFCYHLYMVELLLWDLLIINQTNPNILKTNKQFDKFKKRLQKILDYTYQMLGRDEFIPQIGDNDSGFFLGIDNDNNSLKNIKKILKLLSLENKSDIQNIIHESDLYKSLDNYEITNNVNKSIIFNQSGVFIYHNDDYKIWINLPTKAQFGKGGHNHQDITSFILQAGDNPVIVDPGTYVYTAFPEIRNLFRSYYYHNSYCPLDYEIKTREIDDLFWLQQEKCKFSINLNIITLERKIDKLIHKRKFILNNNSVEIIDEFDKIPNGKLLLHLHPSTKILTEENNIIKLLCNNIQLSIISSNNNIILDKYYYSNKYGNKLDSKVIIFNNLIKDNSIKFEILNGTTSK